MAGKRDWGRIRQLPSGRWQARYPGPDGKLRPAPQTFERKADTSNWLANKRAEINRDEWIDPAAGKATFGLYAASWLKERDLAETTAERYEGILRHHVQPYLGDRALAEIKEPVIRQWRKALQDAGVGAPTVAKAYRMVHAMFTTAVDDLLIRRNPCRIKGAGQDKADERPTLTVDQVFAVANAIQPRYRMLVLLGALTSLRFGEFAALRRRDVDADDGELRVRRSQAELKHGRTIIKDPKSEAGKRSVAIPEVVLADLRDHLDRFSEAGPNGLVFVGPNGGQLRRRNFHRLWTKALADAKVEEENVHFHDLRHTGNTLAAATGASTKELMARMGHTSLRAAIIYQHASRTRDKQIADAISHNVQATRGMGHVKGTTERITG
ncbi:MAG: site-specific integrase [Pseudonocardiaceae bacterium]